MLNPLVSLIISFCLLGFMLYRRVKLGITLCVTPIVLALLTIDWAEIPKILYAAIDPFSQEGLLALLVILATFSTSWLSYLYKETKMILVLSEGFGTIIRRQKIILALLPALIGLLPVPGGTLLSAPIVETESKSLGLSPSKMAYINFWFRHIIFIIYPLSPSIIIVAALTGVPLLAILLLQMPVAAIMAVVGYLLGLRGTSAPEGERLKKADMVSRSAFIASFLPILASIALAIALGLVNNRLFQQGLNVVIASIAGLIILVAVSRADLKTFIKPLLNLWIHDVTFATYGAFLLQRVIRAINVGDIIRPLTQSGALGAVGILTVVPLILSFLMGSSMGAIAITASIIQDTLKFSLRSASLLYASAYSGYVIAPTHLCLVFTADYFKTTLSRVYRYVIPSFAITYLATLFIHLLLF